MRKYTRAFPKIASDFLPPCRPEAFRNFPSENREGAPNVYSVSTSRNSRLDVFARSAFVPLLFLHFRHFEPERISKQRVKRIFRKFPGKELSLNLEEKKFFANFQEKNFSRIFRKRVSLAHFEEKNFFTRPETAESSRYPFDSARANFPISASRLPSSPFRERVVYIHGIATFPA